jgi:hypothetical protein
MRSGARIDPGSVLLERHSRTLAQATATDLAE